MKALTWKYPYGPMMVKGKLETRSWPTNYRGLVLICIAKKAYTPEEIEAMSYDYQIDQMDEFLAENLYNHSDILGMAIAVGTLADCVKLSHKHETDTYIRHREGYYAHIYENIRPIKPLAWKGGQGWKNVPQGIIDSIEYLETIYLKAI